MSKMGKSRFSILCLGFFINAVSVTSGVSVGSWNSLVRADSNLFPEAVDTILMTKSDAVGQLKSMLSDSAILSVVYKNYLNSYDKGDRNSASVFAKNLIEIVQHNLRFEAGQTSWDKGVNQFTDMTSEELRQFTGSDLTLSSLFLANLSSPTYTQYGAPDALDWRQEKMVSPVKNQGSCGSCWAFSAASILESSYAKANGGKILDLSEQELLDCDTKNSGCNGGNVAYAFAYMQKNGLVADSSYGYKQKKGSCRRQGDPAAKVSKYGQVRKEDTFKDTIYTYGPVAVSVLCSDEWHQYKSGVFDGSCGKEGHAVNIVGYGSEGGKNYWIIKNSWGERWGDKGYMKLVSGKDKCTVASRNGAYWVTV